MDFWTVSLQIEFLETLDIQDVTFFKGVVYVFLDRYRYNGVSHLSF